MPLLCRANLPILFASSEGFVRMQFRRVVISPRVPKISISVSTDSAKSPTCSHSAATSIQETDEMTLGSTVKSADSVCIKRGVRKDAVSTRCDFTLCSQHLQIVVNRRRKDPRLFALASKKRIFQILRFVGLWQHNQSFRFCPHSPRGPQGCSSARCGVHGTSDVVPR